MDNDWVKNVFWQTYNDFWNKWKNIPLARQSPEWEAMTAEGREIMEKYHCDLCNHMVSEGKVRDRRAKKVVTSQLFRRSKLLDR